MFGSFGPTNLSAMLSRFGGQNSGFWNPRAPKLDPSTGQYNTPNSGLFQQVGPMQGSSKFPGMGGMSRDPFRPRMPRIQPDTPISNYSPISPSGNILDRFLSMRRY